MVGPIALLFPGQGAQFIGMGKDLLEAFPAARRCFEEADTLLGFPLSRICFEGPLPELTRTEICQPALYVTSLAVLAALQSQLKPKGVRPLLSKRGLTPFVAAGLSLGEYTALAAAGALSFQDGLRLVRLRAEAMEEAARSSPGTMASVLGLELDVVEEICVETGAQVANINSPGQLVISGSPQTVQAASEKAKEKGARRVVPLEVGGAFHSRLMEPAALRLEQALEAVRIEPPKVPVVSNVTGAFHSGPEEIRKLLVEQLTHPVRWEACIRTLLKQGIRNFLEVGPGTVLKGLLRKIDPEATVQSVGTADQVLKIAAHWA